MTGRVKNPNSLRAKGPLSHSHKSEPLVDMSVLTLLVSPVLISISAFFFLVEMGSLITQGLHSFNTVPGVKTTGSFSGEGRDDTEYKYKRLVCIGVMKEFG